MSKLLKNLSDIHLKFSILIDGDSVEISLPPGEGQIVDDFISKSAAIFERKQLISITEAPVISEQPIEVLPVEQNRFSTEVLVEIEKDSDSKSGFGIEEEIAQVADYVSESETASVKPKRVYKRKKGPGRPKKRGPKPGSKRKK